MLDALGLLRRNGVACLLGIDGRPQRVSVDAGRARRLLELVPAFPALTWGRDELDTGDMWNSNSLISWLLALSGHRVGAVSPPGNGRAPGWRAGLAAAARSTTAPLPDPDPRIREHDGITGHRRPRTRRSAGAASPATGG